MGEKVVFQKTNERKAFPERAAPEFTGSIRYRYRLRTRWKTRTV